MVKLPVHVQLVFQPADCCARLISLGVPPAKPFVVWVLDALEPYVCSMS